MPEFLEQKLKAEYRAKGKKGRALAHAVYGTLNAIGAMHGNQVTAKGERMQAKHERDTSSLPHPAHRFQGGVHNFDQKRPKRKVVSRYYNRGK